MKYLLLIYFTIGIVKSADPKDVCDTCVLKETCQIYGNMSKDEQQAWIVKFPCTSPEESNFGSPPGFSLGAKGDYVCCSNKIWGITKLNETNNQNASEKLTQNRYPFYNDDDDDGGYGNYNRPSFNNRPGNGNYGPNNRWPNNNFNRPNNNWRRPDQTRPNQWWNSKNPNSGNNNGGNGNGRNVNDGYGNDRTGNGNDGNGNNNNVNNQNPPYLTEGPGFLGPTTFGYQGGQNNNNPQPIPPRTGNGQGNFNNNQQPIPPRTDNGQGNSFSNFGQCDRVTSLPPDPQSGCCGREASDDDRITGGVETELYQFPWTVLLVAVFDYGNKQTAFNCGGSLISSKFILTAGHCVYDKGAVIKSVEVYLAEYDRRTFPRDCKMTSEGRKCVDNMVMYAENVIRHPQYDDDGLLNDIALIKLRGNAPYTDYIRPICLPTINIDDPQYSNLRLTVAGWGRNGKYKSNIKQSTVVNLVPQNQCKKFYPTLSTRHLCAAGYKGEDTCKGDSGGPLMTLYRGKYYVVGVVSGKRSDSPCGTSVPSLYTNVYHYLDWIRNNVRN